MVTSAIKGVYCKVDYGGNDIAEMKNAEIKIESNVIDVSSFDLAWEEIIKGQGKWSITGGFNFINADTAQIAMETAILAPTSAYATVKFQLNSAGDDWYTGSAFVTAFSVKGDLRGPLDGTMTLTGTGAVAREA